MPKRKPSPENVRFGSFVHDFVVRSPLTSGAISRMANKGEGWTSQLVNGRFTPHIEDAKAMDEILNADGQILNAWEEIYGGRNPFADYHASEPDAKLIISTQMIYVPTLVQTPAYARSLTTGDEVLADRLDRRKLLDRAAAPHLAVLLDESVLRRTVGDEEIMREQHDHLIEMSHRPNVTVQIVPYALRRGRVAVSPSGSFSIATMADGSSIAFLEAARSRFGTSTRDPETVADLLKEVATLQAYALNVEDSRTFVREVRGELWT